MPLGRSSGSGPSSRSTSAPTRSVSPGGQGVGAVIGCPSIHVPLRDPRSSTVTARSGPTWTTACRSEIVAASRCTSQSGPRPTTSVPGASGNRAPASRPATTLTQAGARGRGRSGGPCGAAAVTTAPSGIGAVASSSDAST